MVVLFSLAAGTALDAAMGPYRGKRTGEPALFRELHDRLEAGDILLADRCYCSYAEMALCRERGCDAVFRMHSGAAWTSAAAGDWAPRTTWRPGRARPGRSG